MGSSAAAFAVRLRGGMGASTRLVDIFRPRGVPTGRHASRRGFADFRLSGATRRVNAMALHAQQR